MLFRMVVNSLVAGLLLAQASVPALAGGTNSMLGRMEDWVTALEQDKHLSPEEAQHRREEIQQLREKVDQRIEVSGPLNREKDRELFEELDAYGQPLLRQYELQQAEESR